MSEINHDKLRTFLEVVCSRYQKVPYHNFTHAFCLVHFAYWLITHIDADKFFKKDDILAIIVACIGHDLDHPGMNNGWLIKSKNPLALVYNDASVLENMHCSLLFQILSREECNILDTLNRDRFAYVREVVVQGIICTDMSKHNQLVDKLKAIKDYDIENKETRVFLAAMLVHACDLSNLLYEYDHYYKWSIRITQEFQDQYQAEEKLDSEKYGEPTEFLKYNGATAFYKSQIGFMNFVISPMWEAFHSLLQFDKVVLDNMNNNKKRLEENINKE